MSSLKTLLCHLDVYIKKEIGPRNSFELDFTHRLNLQVGKVHYRFHQVLIRFLNIFSIKVLR